MSREAVDIQNNVKKYVSKSAAHAQNTSRLKLYSNLN